MRIVLIGPPGAGKGTQAQKLADYFLVPNISTGELLRSQIQADSALGRLAKQHVDRGDLVPDEIVLTLVQQRLNLSDCNSGFLLDGFPRTVAQAASVQALLHKRGGPLDGALKFQVDANEVVSRMLTRARADDQPQVILQRIANYERAVDPLVEFYRERHLLELVDAQGAVNQVFQRLLSAIDRLRTQTLNKSAHGPHLKWSSKATPKPTLPSSI